MKSITASETYLAMKRRGIIKGKKQGRERYIQLNAEFQRIARKHKKPFFNEQHFNELLNNRRKQLKGKA